MGNESPIPKGSRLPIGLSSQDNLEKLCTEGASDDRKVDAPLNQSPRPSGRNRRRSHVENVKRLQVRIAKALAEGD